jgi:hypothetical protein
MYIYVDDILSYLGMLKDATEKVKFERVGLTCIWEEKFKFHKCWSLIMLGPLRDSGIDVGDERIYQIWCWFGVGNFFLDSR